MLRNHPGIGHTKECCSLCFSYNCHVAIHLYPWTNHILSCHTYIHIGSTSKANPFRDIFNKRIFHGIPTETSVFIIGKVTLPRSHRGPGMVRRYTKGGRKLSSGRLCVDTAIRGARRPRAKSIDKAGELMGTSQWAQQKEVLRPIWTDSVFDNGKDRQATDQSRYSILGSLTHMLHL